MTTNRKSKYVPLTRLRTNELSIRYDLDEFLKHYAVVSYSMDGDWKDDKYRNLAYSHLGELPILSVVGMYDQFERLKKNHRFFVLTRKVSAQRVINALQEYENVKVGEDDLKRYPENTCRRILASLAINSIGKVKAGARMYHDGELLIVNDNNFGFNEMKDGMVCLRVKVDEDLHLVGQTATFSQPWNFNAFKDRKYRVLKVGKDVAGAPWLGRSLKPVGKRDITEAQFSSYDYYIQKAKWPDSKNIIPYWDYDKERYLNGKLFIMSEILKTVNSEFPGMLSLAFREHDVVIDDNYKSLKDTESLLVREMLGKKIYFDNEFNDSGSEALIQRFKSVAEDIVGDLSWAEDRGEADMVISLCPPKDVDQAQNGNQMYMRPFDRKESHHIPVQHVVYDPSESKKDLKNTARRCLLDLMVKHALTLHDIPQQMANITSGWSFALYRIQDSVVNGSVVRIDDGKLTFTDMEMPGGKPGMTPGEFNKKCLLYAGDLNLAGQQYYHAVKKDGNVYLIADTKEIPILDADAIDQAYDEMRQTGNRVSMFKRVGIVSKYLGPYVGFHLWNIHNPLAADLPAFAYLVGKERGDIKVTEKIKIDKMPHVRHVMALHLAHPERFEEDRDEIIAMLKFGLGRWKEMMTYPVAFKFLEEHLEAVSLRTAKKHWR